MSATERYPPEILDNDNEDNGTIVANVTELAETVIGRRITSVARGEDGERDGTVITLDDGRRVTLRDTGDCCAYTTLEAFLLHPERVDHVILGVGTTDGYQTWHIFADLGDVLELTVGWSAGNPFYYGYGFDIEVEPAPGEVPESG